MSETSKNHEWPQKSRGFFIVNIKRMLFGLVGFFVLDFPLLIVSVSERERERQLVLATAHKFITVILATTAEAFILPHLLDSSEQLILHPVSSASQALLVTTPLAPAPSRLFRPHPRDGREGAAPEIFHSFSPLTQARWCKERVGRGGGARPVFTGGEEGAELP